MSNNTVVSNQSEFVPNPSVPLTDLKGKPVKAETDFFVLPYGIGNILSGHSDLYSYRKPLSTQQKLWFFLTPIIITTAVTTLIALHVLTDNTTGVIAFFLILFLLAYIITFVIFKKRILFTYYCNAIGTEGFAEFITRGSRENIIKRSTVRFDTISDVFVSDRNEEGETEIEFEEGLSFKTKPKLATYKWINHEQDKTLYKFQSLYNHLPFKPAGQRLVFNRAANKRWTDFLLENMQKTLSQKGHLSFNAYNKITGKLHPYIELSPKYIAVTHNNKKDTYLFSDNYHLSIIEDTLFIKQKNTLTDKTVDHEYSLTQLCNRLFFEKAVSKVMSGEL